MRFVGEVCDWVVALDFGQKLTEGPLAEVQRDERVRAAYLGQAA
jgi:branched-chain amino acid transport system ATP-binding protein